MTVRPSPESAHVAEHIRAEATALGFDVCRFVSAEADARNGDGLAAFIEAGHHGQMQWMEARKEQRADPQKLWSDAKSVIMLGVNYGP